MRTARVSLLGLASLLLASCTPTAPAQLGRTTSGLELAVPGDYPTIQAALDAAGAGDTVVVAAGEYYEKVNFKENSITLQGAGPTRTILHGGISDGNNFYPTVTGFKVVAEPGVSGGIGLDIAGMVFTVTNCIVEGFGWGILVSGENVGEISGNVVRRNEWGIALSETGEGDRLRIHHNLILNNTKAGVRITSFSTALVLHNTIVGNGFGATYDQGGAGVYVRSHVTERVQNNIIVYNNGGLNLAEPSADNHHNLVWANTTNYVGEATAGAGDLGRDPLFVDQGNKDFRLRPDSPAVNAGVDWGFERDFAGNLRFVGTAPDLGAFEVQATPTGGDLVINEVMANPLDEARGEFVELYNPTSGPLDAAGLVLDDGDATDILVALGSGSTVVPAGGYAVILDRDHGELAAPYELPAATILLTVDSAALGSGLSTTDPVTLWRSGAMISSFQHPFNPGNGVSAERIDPSGPDVADGWAASPCGSSPGKANCISSGGSSSGQPLLVVTEVMASPADQATHEFVELYNYGDAPVELVGLKLSDGDSTDEIEAVPGKASLLPPGGYAVIIDRDYIATMAGPPYELAAAVPVVVTVDDGALGNGLAKDDPLTLYAADGQTVIATYSHPVSTSQQSVERRDLLEADVAGNWVPSPCAAQHSAGRPNCASTSQPPAQTPVLVITEVMANPLDEYRGEFVELHNPGTSPIDAAGLVISDGDSTDVLGPFPGRSATVIPAGGYGVILDRDYTGGYPIPAGAVWLAPANSAIGNGLATTDPVTLLAADGRTVLSTFSFPFNPGNGISVERQGSAGDVQTNWVPSPCATGSSPGALNCASGGGGSEPGIKLVISEVLANALDEATGEFVEIVNLGAEAVDLAGYQISDGDATDPLEGFGGGATVLPAGGYAVILDRSYPAGTYNLPAGTILLTTPDQAIGSGLATTDPITLLTPEGAVASTFATPFNPGDGVSAERVDPAAADTPDNWVTSECPSGSSPGAPNCASGGPPAGITVVDVNTATLEELTQITGIGTVTAGQIVAYRDANGAYEALEQLTVLEGITQARLNDWMVAGEGDAPYVIGLSGAKEVKVFTGVAGLLAALPDPASPGTWDGTPVRVQRAVALDQSNSSTQQSFTFADWGDEGAYSPTGGAQLPVFLDKAPGQASYARDQTDHANATADWTKEDGDPYLVPDFYRWSTPLPVSGQVPFAHVFTLQGVVEVVGGAWRLRVRAQTDAGLDRIVMIERWLPAQDWEQLEVVWTYGYKSVVVSATSGYSYSLPYRLALAHPCRAYWFQAHAVWIDVPRCVRYGECAAMTADWTLFNQALAAWKEVPAPGGGYCFAYDGVDYCFTPAEETTGLEILNNASLTNLQGHCYTTTLANIVLGNRPFSSIPQYDETSGVGGKSLWNLLVCYVRSGHWPPAPEGTVQRILQDVPAIEGEHVDVNRATVTSVTGVSMGTLVRICDPGTEHCIPVYSYKAVPPTLSVGDTLKVHGRVRYYDTGGYWELALSTADDTYLEILEEG